jgi:hypothetical protein
MTRRESPGGSGQNTISPSAPLEEVRAKFGEHGVRRLLVVGPGGPLLGILAWADLAPRATVAGLGEVVADVLEKP